MVIFDLRINKLGKFTLDTKVSKYKTIELISTFRERDFRSFEKFLASPYFNESPLMIRLFEVFKNTENKSEISKFTPIHIHKQLFPEKPYNNTNIRKLLSNFNKLLEDYLRQVNYEKYSKFNDIYLLREINQRFSGDLFVKMLDEYMNSFSDNEKGYMTYYNNKILLEYEEFRHFLSSFDVKCMHNVTEKIENTFKESVIFNSVFIYLMIKFHSFYCTHTLKLQPITKYFRIIKNDVPYYKENFPYVYSGYLLSVIFDKNDYSLIKELLEYMSSNSERIFYGAVDFILNLLMVYMVTKHESGEEITDGDILNLLETFDKLGVIKRKRLIPPHYFTALARFKRNPEEVDETVKFISSQISKVGPSLRDDVFYISAAYLYYSVKDYYMAEDYLAHIGSRNPFSYFEANILLLKICFENREFGKFALVFKKFEMFMRRSKLFPEKVKADTLKFIRFLNEFAKLKKSRLPLSSLKSSVASEPPFFNKEYLLSI